MLIDFFGENNEMLILHEFTLLLLHNLKITKDCMLENSSGPSYQSMFILSKDLIELHISNIHQLSTPLWSSVAIKSKKSKQSKAELKNNSLSQAIYSKAKQINKH